MTKDPFKLKITAYPALSIAIITTPFGDTIKWLIWWGVSNGKISDSLFLRFIFFTTLLTGVNKLSY